MSSCVVCVCVCVCIDVGREGSVESNHSELMWKNSTHYHREFDKTVKYRVLLHMRLPVIRFIRMLLFLLWSVLLCTFVINDLRCLLTKCDIIRSECMIAFVRSMTSPCPT